MSSSTPVRLNGVSQVSEVVRGCNSSFAIRSDGSAYAWGSNGGGRLGDGSTTDRSTPVTISLANGRRFRQIQTSYSHTLAVATDGSVWAWGGNAQGQLARDPSALAFSASPLRVDIGSTTGVSVIATDSTPFSSVITSTGAVMRWGGWGTTEFRPTSMSLPLDELAGRKLVSGSSMNSASAFVAEDGSLWAKSGWGSTDLDGNCGATASDWASWNNGAWVAARPLVRVLSSGQFGSTFAEDTLSIARFETGSGASLPLDGTGGASATVGTAMTLVATAPQSMCFDTSDLSYAFSDDNGATWSSSNITVGTDAYDHVTATVSYTPSSSGRKRAQFKVVNPNGQSVVYRLIIGVAAAASSGGGSNSPASALPIAVVSSDGRSVVAIGTNGLLYGWGADTRLLGTSATVVEPLQIVPSNTPAVSPTTSTTSTTTVTTTTVAVEPMVPETNTPPTTTLPETTTSSAYEEQPQEPSDSTTTPTTTEPTTSSESSSTSSSIPSATTTSTSPESIGAQIAEEPEASLDNSALTFQSISMGNRSSCYGCAEGSLNNVVAGVSTTGRLFVWGKGGHDYITGSTRDLTAPTEIRLPDGVVARSVTLVRDSMYGHYIDNVWVYSLVGIVLDVNGAIYVWGGSAASATPKLAGGVAGLTIDLIRNTSSSCCDSRVILRSAAGELFSWNPRRTNCGNSPGIDCYDGSAAPQMYGFSGPVSSKFTLGYLNGYSSSSNGIFEITSAGQLRFTSLGSDGYTVGESTALSLPGGRTAVDIGSGPTVVANDGTVWRVQSREYPAYQIQIPIDLQPIARIGSLDGTNNNWLPFFLVGSGGSLISLTGTSVAAGTCAKYTQNSYGSRQAWRVTSTGQFGAAFNEDTFSLAVDSPRQISFYDTRNGDPLPTYPFSRVVAGIPLSNYAVYPITQAPYSADGQTRTVDLRPGTSTEVYAYFKSSCDGTSNLSAAWDLDNDGDYETPATVTEVTQGTTSLTTARPSSDPLDASTGVLEGVKEVKVTIDEASPGGSLSSGGGRFIGLQLSSSKGTSTEQIALIVRPKKPEGRIGVTINAGARFTDASGVNLGVVWPEGTTTLIISNDGSFATAQEVPVTSSVRWQLPSEGSGLLSSTVYVRFKSLRADGEGWSRWEGETNYTDDIVQDLTPPEITSVSASSESTSVQSQSFPAGHRIRLLSEPTSTASVRLSASDAASGIAAVQITTDPAVPGPERVVARSYRITAERGTVAVRAKDNVGHWSPWTYTQISGYTAPSQGSPSPNPPTEPQPGPSNPTPARPETGAGESTSPGNSSGSTDLPDGSGVAPSPDPQKSSTKEETSPQSQEPAKSQNLPAQPTATKTPGAATQGTPKAPTLSVSKSMTTKSFASATKTKIPPGAGVILRAKKPSSSCRVSSTRIQALKSGSCTIIMTITPKRGRPIVKTITLKVTK